LSYDVFVSDGPVGSGGERMPDGAPLTWSPLSSTLISGQRDALLVDPPFTRTQIRAVGDWVERSGRRLAYIYATHGHGDHRSPLLVPSARADARCAEAAGAGQPRTI
jgi:glyoxylase-like metal-dependent hydrolase (beta-lactamase superfamily II)